MLTIAKSGLYQNDLGESFLITQGVIGYTLVAGKQFLFRSFVSPVTLTKINAVKVVISGNGSPSRGILIPKSELITEWSSPNGPSVGFIIRGFAFAKSGTYSIMLSFKDDTLTDLGLPMTYALQFAPTKDLRIMVVPLIGSAPSRNFLFTDAWNIDIDKAMQRLGSMFPVRDCVLRGLKHKVAAGIRYEVAKPLEAWPLEVGIPAPDYLAETKAINAQTTSNTDRIDVTILYRPVQPNYNEPPGGIAAYGGITQALPTASCVAGWWAGLSLTAPCFAQEIGHLFGLEPGGSPHFQDPANPMHSKDPSIYDPYAFDFVNKRIYPAPNHFLGDPMNNLGNGVFQGADSVMYNAYDWEYVRQGLMNLNANSTGTEINPAVRDVCAFIRLNKLYKTIPVPPNTFVETIGSRADGKQYVWTNNGFVPVIPPGDPYAKFFAQTTKILLKEFIKNKVDEVYIPVDNKVMEIIGSQVNSLDSGHTDLLNLDSGKNGHHHEHKISEFATE